MASPHDVRATLPKDTSSTPHNFARAEGWESRLRLHFANCALNLELA